MEKKNLLPLLSKADKEAVFEKIFKNYHIAVVGDDDVFEIMYDTKTRLWMRKRVSRALVSENIIGYIIGRYVIILKKEADRCLNLILAIEMPLDADFCLLPCGKYDFALRGISSQGMFTYQLYKYHPEKESYEAIDLGEIQPDDLGQPYKSTVDHHWNRLYIRKESLQCPDNTIFYGYIIKYWQD